MTHMPKLPLVEHTDMAKITLFEFNPRGRIQIGPAGPGDSGLFTAELLPEEKDTDGEEADADEIDEDESGGSIAKVLIPLVLLAVIAVAVKTFTGRGEEELDEIDGDEQESGRLDRFTSTTE